MSYGRLSTTAKTIIAFASDDDEEWSDQTDALSASAFKGNEDAWMDKYFNAHP